VNGVGDELHASVETYISLYSFKNKLDCFRLKEGFIYGKGKSTIPHEEF